MIEPTYFLKQNKVPCIHLQNRFFENFKVYFRAFGGPKSIRMNPCNSVLCDGLDLFYTPQTSFAVFSSLEKFFTFSIVFGSTINLRDFSRKRKKINYFLYSP